MTMRFTKMQGLGNDFVVIDAVRQELKLDPQRVRWLADRHWGVGCDQVLVVERARTAGVDFGYRIFNADGGEVEQCGNGARCFAAFVRAHGLMPDPQARTLHVQTQSGMITLRFETNGEISVNMGVPRFAPAEIPFSAPGQALTYTLPIEEWPGGQACFSAVSMGNPHAVLVVDAVDAVPVDRQGALLERHPAFSQRVNVGFMEVTGKRAFRLRVYERGVGETWACGTGACAATVIGIRRGLIESPARVELRGGALTVAWGGADDAPVWMTGPATTVFEGELDWPAEIE
jgi:diaminopimelate epimerase